MERVASGGVKATSSSSGEASRASALAPRPRGIKHAIAFVCRALGSLGVSQLTAEDVRKSKFNDDSPRLKLWAAIHDTIILSQTSFSPRVANKLRRAASSRSNDLGSQGKRQQWYLMIEYALTQLNLWHCPLLSPDDTFDGIGSRSLLLVLVWLIARSRAMNVVVARRIEELKATSPFAICPAVDPSDTLFCRHVHERYERSRSDAEHYVRGVKSEAVRKSVWGAVDLRANQVLVMIGKVRSHLNALLALQLGYVKKSQRLRRAQAEPGTGGGGAAPKTKAMDCFESYVHKHKGFRATYAKHLESCKATVFFLQDFAALVPEFSEWMRTVAEMDVHDRASHRDAESEGSSFDGGRAGATGGGKGGGGGLKLPLYLPQLLKVEDQLQDLLRKSIASHTMFSHMRDDGTAKLFPASEDARPFGPFLDLNQAREGGSDVTPSVTAFWTALERYAGEGVGGGAEGSQELASGAEAAPISLYSVEAELGYTKDVLLALAKGQARIRAHNLGHIQRALASVQREYDILSRDRIDGSYALA